jgi:hypothetical protein
MSKRDENKNMVTHQKGQCGAIKISWFIKRWALCVQSKIS